MAKVKKKVDNKEINWGETVRELVLTIAEKDCGIPRTKHGARVAGERILAEMTENKLQTVQHWIDSPNHNRPRGATGVLLKTIAKQYKSKVIY